MDARVQGLDAAVEALGEAGQLLDLGDGDAGGGDTRGGRAGGDELDTGPVQPLGELFEPGLVVDADERAADGPPVPAVPLVTRRSRDNYLSSLYAIAVAGSAPRPRRAANARLP